MLSRPGLLAVRSATLPPLRALRRFRIQSEAAVSPNASGTHGAPTCRVDDKGATGTKRRVRATTSAWRLVTAAAPRASPPHLWLHGNTCAPARRPAHRRRAWPRRAWATAPRSSTSGWPHPTCRQRPTRRPGPWLPRCESTPPQLLGRATPPRLPVRCRGPASSRHSSSTSTTRSEGRRVLRH